MDICKKCSQIIRTCCEKPTVDVALTNADIERIATVTQLRDFYELRDVEGGSYSSPANYSKEEEIYIMNIFKKDGRRNVLKHKNNGKCVLLGDNGCIVSFDVRPLLCRIYPYDWNDNREIWLNPTYCPKELFKDENEMVENIAVDLNTARELVDQLYNEIMKSSDEL